MKHKRTRTQRQYGGFNGYVKADGQQNGGLFVKSVVPHNGKTFEIKLSLLQAGWVIKEPSGFL